MTSNLRNEKAKLVYAKSATQEAVQLARCRQREILGLKKELEDTYGSLKLSEITCSENQHQLITLQNSIVNHNTMEEKLKSEVKSIKQLLSSHKNEIPDLRNKLEIERLETKNLKEENYNLKQQCKSVRRENHQLKREMATTSQTVEETKRSKTETQCYEAKLSQLRESKRHYKEKIQKLHVIIAERNDELHMKNGTVENLQREIQEVQTTYESFHEKTVSKYKYAIQHLQKEHIEKNLINSNTITELEKNIHKVSLEKQQIEINASSIQEKMERETHIREKVESQLKAVKRSLQEYTNRTQLSLDTIQRDI